MLKRNHRMFGFVHSLEQPQVASLTRHIVSVAAASYSALGGAEGHFTKCRYPNLFALPVLDGAADDSWHKSVRFFEIELFWLEMVKIMLLSTK